MAEESEVPRLDMATQADADPVDGDAQRSSNQQAAADDGADPADSPREFSLLVVLQPDGVRHRILVTPDHTVTALTEQICSDLRLSPELLSFPDFVPAPGLTLNETTLATLGFDGAKDEERIVHAYVARKLSSGDYVMPDHIQVQVFDGSVRSLASFMLPQHSHTDVPVDEQESFRTFAVEVVKFTGRKPYLGGFRHRKTMQIFHHASAQTVLTRARRNYGPRAYRETQTQELTTRSVQTRRESGTQMERHDLRLDSSKDRVLAAKPYFDSYQLQCLREDSVLLIQRLYRGYKARAYVHSLRDQRRRVAAMNQLEAQENAIQDADHQKREAQENAIQDADHQKREVQRRMHPKTVGDFEVLYNELDKWRQVETRKLEEDRAMSEDERQRAMEGILAKETKLLQTIDRLKLTASDSNRKQRIESMLQFMSRPKQWQMSDGGVREVHTPFTIRAKELMDLYHGLKLSLASVDERLDVLLNELMDLYHGLKLSLASVDERLDVLLNVKWTVKEFDCALTREIIELIDREADMLSRGRKKESLEGLRKRLTNLFLQFIENPEFNPEASALKHPKPT
ncbi:hypothetical protein ATCC90586_000328 [Pythium insidiosum]|nr:hypothetical protein ATCC90586_000328 [Pythium insidiosum]